MKKVCKTAVCAVVILLLGVFSQQEAKAGEANEKRYSRAYSVLSANVGNSYPGKDTAGLKLQTGSDEERVKKGIQEDLKKPDILILIEASNKEQVLRICNGEVESYFVFGGDYDFICVKKEIIAKKDNGKQDIKEEHMPEDGSYEKYKGNSVGYVDVGLKDEEGRKVRLFYAHFPSWGKSGWTRKLHQAHMEAFDWICRNLNPSIPYLIAGDLNNDFIRTKAELDILPMPPSYLEQSSLYIEKRARDSNMWIFNSLAQPLQLQFLDGSTKQNYEATYRLLEEAWKMTIDWVMGKNVVPPFLAPGGPKTDLITGTTGTVRTNFVTSPPNWWKDTGSLTFDHKPLYGKVVFSWEELIQPPARGKILFVSYRDGNDEIYVMNADGSGQTNLTRNPARDENPAWSPDGKKIAFTSNRDGNWELYAMKADGSEQINLSRNPATDGYDGLWGPPVWSPDGTKITFWSHREGKIELYEMNADGSGQTKLPYPLSLESKPRWSPDGTKIAFESYRDGNREIYVMNEDGSELTNLTRNPKWDSYPAWSPDGTKIAFVSKRDGDDEIYVMKADGSGQTRITHNSGWGGRYPTWSPDGTKIAFASWRDRKLDIHVINADGNGQTNLTRNPEWDENPVWSPR